MIETVTEGKSNRGTRVKYKSRERDWERRRKTAFIRFAGKVRVTLGTLIIYIRVCANALYTQEAITIMYYIYVGERYNNVEGENETHVHIRNVYIYSALE